MSNLLDILSWKRRLFDELDAGVLNVLEWESFIIRACAEGFDCVALNMRKRLEAYKESWKTMLLYKRSERLEWVKKESVIMDVSQEKFDELYAQSPIYENGSVIDKQFTKDGKLKGWTCLSADGTERTVIKVKFGFEEAGDF